MKSFEDAFMEEQSDLISLCLEVAEDKADKIYAYASIEEKSRSFNAFFLVNNSIQMLYEINDNRDLRRQFLELGTSDLEKIKKVCDEFSMPTPTELKMIYDVRSGHFDAEYKYEHVCTAENGVVAADVFMAWYEEMKVSSN